MSIQHISPIELHQQLEKSSLLLLDVREPWEFAVCHIDASQLIPMRTVPNKISTLNPQQKMIIVCHHGIRSLQVAHYLVGSGFQDVINLTGGIAAWARDVDPEMPTY